MRKEFLTCVIILLLALFAFSIGIGSKSYSNPDEKRYIQSAAEMVESGDWITPRYHGRPRFQKPILFYWLAASGVYLSGNNWMGARLPSAVSGAMAVLLVYLLGKCMYNRRTGLFSASLLVISEMFFMYSRLATPDMTTLFFITLSMYVFAKLYFQDAPRSLSCILFIGLALATLTKGFIGLLIPLIAITIFSSIFKKEGLFKRINLPLGLALFFIIALPWFVVMYKVHGDLYINHIWQVETLNRTRNLWGGGHNTFLKILKYFGRYILMTFVVFLPSTIFLPGTVINTIKRKDTRAQDWFTFLWILTVIIFFTLIGTKKIHYLLPLAPPLCILIGKYLANFTEGKRNRLKMVQVFIVVALVIFIAAFGYILPGLSRSDGLIVLSEKILSIRKEGETVGVGSHFISHNRLASYMGIKVKKVNVDLYDPKEQFKTSRGRLRDFLDRKERVFCLIIRKDYEDYMPEELRERIFILDKGWYWKKPNQLKLDKALLSTVLKGDKEAFNRLVKNEIYLISNKP